MEESKTRKNISLKYSIMKDMCESGLNISEFVEECWLEKKFSTTALKEEIEKLKEELKKKEEQYKNNIKFLDKFYKNTSPQEKLIFKNMEIAFQKIKDDPFLIDNFFNKWSKVYMDKLKLMISANMIKKKFEAYLKDGDDK